MMIVVTFFVEFLERVLHLRDALKLKKFGLSCHAFDNESQMYSWISYAIRHKVDEIF